MTSGSGKKPTKRPRYKLPDADELKNRALSGLFRGLGLDDYWLRYLKYPGRDTSSELTAASIALLQAAKEIGAAIRSEERTNNQFALYNLAYPRILLEELKKNETAEVKSKIAVYDDDENVPINRIAQAIAHLQGELAGLADSEGKESQNAGKNVASGVTKYFKRSSLRMTQRENYGFILFFHIGIAHHENIALSKEKVLKGSPAIYEMVRSALGALEGNAGSPATLLNEAVDALRSRRNKRAATTYLGGLLELGQTDIRNLWSPLFGKLKKDHDTLSKKVSEERHYVCYRLSSSLINVRVLKSFLVLQAPGTLRDKPKSHREHFAVKAFTKYDGGLTRSVGAIVPLGNEIVCFASRRDKADSDTNIDRQPPSNFRGATMLIFSEKWFQGASGILSGMLMTTNQDTRSAACPIICIPSCSTHSDQVKLGLIEANQLADDLCRFTRLESCEGADTDGLTQYVWKNLLQASGLEGQKVGKDWVGYPPIVAHNIKPADLLSTIEGFGFKMKNPS